jgi:hypothetical protein
MQKLFYPLKYSEVSGLELLVAAGESLYEGKKGNAKIELSNETHQGKISSNLRQKY